MHRRMRFRRNRPEQLLVQRRPEMPVRRPLDKKRLQTKEKSDEEIKLTDDRGGGYASDGSPGGGADLH